MEGSQTPITEADIARIVEAGEGVVAVLGAKFLRAGASLNRLKKTVLVLTDTNIHQAGIYKVPKGEKGLKEERGTNSFPVGDLRSVETIERPVPDWIGLWGWVLLIGGFVVMAAGFAFGGGFAIAIALFVGPVWMSVPGALMLIYAKTGKDTLLQFTFGDREFAVSCRDFSESELAEFKQRCAEKIGQ